MSAPVQPEPDDLLEAAFPTLNTLAARNHNPGNLRDPRTGTFRKFATPQEGFTALLEDVRAKQEGRTRTGLNGDSTLIQFFNIYAPPHENDTEHYASTVARRLGLTVDAKIKNVSPVELAKAIAAFEDHEYWNTIQGAVTADVQPVKPSEAPEPVVDDSLLDAAFGTEVQTSAQKLVEQFRKLRPRDPGTPEQQAAVIDALRTPGQEPGKLPEPTQFDVLPAVREATDAHAAPMTPEEVAAGTRRMTGEGRADFLTRTKDARKLSADQDAQVEAIGTIGPAKTGWEGFKEKLTNMRLFSGGQLVSLSQTPGGIDIGQMFRLGNQILAPTVGEVMEGNPDQAFNNFLGIGKGFARALADPFLLYPAAVLYDVASDENYLLPEERSQYIRSTAANYAGLFVGYGAGRVYGSTKTAVLTAGRQSLAETPTAVLGAISRVAVPGNFRARVLKGTVEGLAGGAATGFLEGKNAEERRDLAVSYMLMALPLGLAFEGIGASFSRGKHATVDQAVVAEAKDLYRLKQLRVTENTNGDRVTANLYSMATEHDLARAVIRAGSESGEPVIVTGIEGTDPINENFVLTNVNESGAVFVRPDGKIDYLHMSDFSPGEEVAPPVVDAPPVVETPATPRTDPLDLPPLVEHVERIKRNLRSIEARGRAIRGRRGLWAERTAEQRAARLKVDAEAKPKLEAQLAEAMELLDDVQRTEVADRAEARTEMRARLDKLMEKFRRGEVPDENPIEAAVFELSERLDDGPEAAPPRDEDIPAIEAAEAAERAAQTRALDELIAPAKAPVTAAIPERTVPPVVEAVADTRPPMKDNRHAKAMFAISGFLPDQAVHFLGQDYTYKGPVFEKGKLVGHTIVDQHGVEFEVPWNLLQRNADVLISPLEIDKYRAQKALYRDFKRTVNTIFDEEGKLKPDAIPDVPFTTLIDNYIKAKRLSVDEVMPLRQFLEDRFGFDLMSQSLSAEERALYHRLMTENARYKAQSASDVVDLATASGFYIEANGGSGRVLRDVETGQRVGTFHTNESMRKFIVESGRAESVSLDGNGTVPPSIGRGVMTTPPPPNGPHTAPFQFTKDGPLRQFSHWFNTTLLGTRLTGMRQVMIALDAQLGTNFVGEVWDPNYDAFKRKHAASHEDIKRAAGIAQMARGMDPAELEHVTTLLETMSAQDMVKSGGLFKTRAFTDREIAGANWFINHKIDIAKAFQYRRALINLERKLRDNPELGAAVRKLQAVMAVDENHVEAARIIGEVLRINDPSQLSIYGITRLANAVMNGDLAPDKYIEANKLSPRAVNLAKMIREHFDDLAPKFDIPDESRLGGYFAHYRNFKDDIPIVNQDNIPVFVSDLLRTGEMTEYDRDPINVLVRYINAGYNRKFTKEGWDNAARYIDRVTARLGEDGPFISRLLKENYLNELRGIPHDSSRLAQGFLDKMLERIGVKTTVNARRDLVNTALSLSSSAAIGFRPMQGIRDIQNFISIFYSRFGAKRTGNMLSIIAQYSPEELKQMGVLTDVLPDEGVQSALHREGITPTISPINVLTAEERLQNSLSGKTTGFREVVQKTGELGIKWGLQYNVYQWAHSAAYLESYLRGLNVLNDLVHGKFGEGVAAKAKAYRELAIDSYDVPVLKEFDRLVVEGKFEDAAKFLGRASSFETVSVFGLANHPAGWGTNTGRLLGQFGSWPVWARSQVMRLMSRGTMKNRAAATARFAMTQGATKAASWSMGLNLSSWFLIPGAFGFRGGPVAGTLGAAMDVIGGSERERDQAVDVLARNWMLGIPGSFLARDIIEGAQMAGAGYNPISALARTLGVRSTEAPSMLNPYGMSQP